MLSSLANAPPLVRPTGAANSSQKVTVTQPMGTPALVMESQPEKRQQGHDPIADLFADEDLHVPGIRALAGDSRRKFSRGKRKEEKPAKSFALSGGNEVLEAELKARSLESSEMDRSSPRTPREEFIIERQRRVALVQQCPADGVGLCEADMGRSSSTPAKVSSPISRSVPKRKENEAPDKPMENCEEKVFLEMMLGECSLAMDQKKAPKLLVGESSHEEAESEFLRLVMSVSHEMEMMKFQDMEVERNLTWEKNLTWEEEIKFPELDDEWGETDILRMLPDSSESQSREPSATESFNSCQDTQPSTTKAEAVPEFGDYQPSILLGPKRSPLAGRRSSPDQGTLPRRLPSAVKTTYIKLTRGVEGLDKTSESEKNLEGLNSGTLSSDILNIQSSTKPKEHEGKLARSSQPDSATAYQGAGLSNEVEMDLGHLRQLDDSSFAKDDHQELADAQRPAVLALLQSPRNLHKDPGKSTERRGSRTPVVNEEESNRKEKVFLEFLLAERNLLQTKLDSERDSIAKERETFQAKLDAEREDHARQRKTLQTKLDSEREAFLTKAKIDDDHRQRDIQQVHCAQQSLQKEKDALMVQAKGLREENHMLKEEVLQKENQRLALEKKVSEAQLLREETFVRKLEAERAEAQRQISQLSSEVQLLKSSSIITQEKTASRQKLHEQELETLQTVHAQELQARDQQIETERKFLSDQRMTMERLAQLLHKGDEWAVRVDLLQGALGVDRELCNNDRKTWLQALDRTVTQSQTASKQWEAHCNGIQKKLEQLLVVLEHGVKEVNTLRLDEKDRLDKEHAYVKSLQESMQGERAQSLADLTAAREKLEGMRIMCVAKKEEFLNACAQERKEIAAEREVVVHLREQLVKAEVAFERQVMEHAVLMQSETEDSAKQRKELERAKDMAAELAQEVEEGRLELEQQRRSFEQEISRVQSLSAQAQQKVENAMEMKKAASKMKTDADALNQQAMIRANDLENQKRQAAIAQAELLNLKRKHDEERARLAFERQQFGNVRNGNYRHCAMGTSVDSQSSVLPAYDSQMQLLDVISCNSLQRGSHGHEASLMPTKASLLANSHGSLGQAPWLLEDIEVSLCLQAQEDYLEEAKNALQSTAQKTSNLLMKASI